MRMALLVAGLAFLPLIAGACDDDELPPPPSPGGSPEPFINLLRSAPLEDDAPPPTSPGEALGLADAVVVGRLIEVQPAEDAPGAAILAIEIDRVFRGDVLGAGDVAEVVVPAPVDANPGELERAAPIGAPVAAVLVRREEPLPAPYRPWPGGLWIGAEDGLHGVYLDLGDMPSGWTGIETMDALEAAFAGGGLP